MYIDNVLLDILIETLDIQYSGTHCPHRETPLYGRAAYWRVSLQGCGFHSKITTPVKVLNPRPSTLKKLFRAELKKRIEAIHERATTSHYGEVVIEYRDPYGMKGLVESMQRKFIDINYKNTEAMKSLRGA